MMLKSGCFKDKSSLWTNGFSEVYWYIRMYVILVKSGLLAFSWYYILQSVFTSFFSKNMEHEAVRVSFRANVFCEVWIDIFCFFPKLEWLWKRGHFRPALGSTQPRRWFTFMKGTLRSFELWKRYRDTFIKYQGKYFRFTLNRLLFRSHYIAGYFQTDLVFPECHKQFI